MGIRSSRAGERAAAEEFAGALTGPPTSAEGRLAERLLRAGVELRSATELAADVRASQRTRLLAVAAVHGVGTSPEPAAPCAPRAWAKRVSASRRTAVLAGAMASIVVLGGVGAAASQSLPGDPFYGVKRSTEAVQLRLAGSEADRGARHLAVAGTRLREVAALTNGRDALRSAGSPGAGVGGSGGPVALGGSQTDRVRDALEDMDDQTRDGSRLLTEAARQEADPSPLVVLQDFTVAQAGRLDALLPGLDAASRARAVTSLALLADVGVESAHLIDLGFCTTACDPPRAAPGLPGEPAGACDCPAPDGSDPLPTGTTPPIRPTTPGPPQGPAISPGGPAAPPTTVPGRPGPPATGGTPTAPPDDPTDPTDPPLLPSQLPLPAVPGLPLPTSLPVPLPLPPGLPGLPGLPGPSLPLPTIPPIAGGR